MIEIISLSGLLLSSFMGYIFNFFDFKEIYCSAYGALLLFMVFGRCFITSSSNQMIPEKKRLKRPQNRENLLLVMPLQVSVSCYRGLWEHVSSLLIRWLIPFIMHYIISKSLRWE